MELKKKASPREGEAILQEIKKVHSSYIDLELEMPYIAQNARPGQFIMIRGWEGNDPILLRPFDVVTVDKDRGTFRIIAKIIGRGTSLLAELTPGEKVRVLGPLGNPVEIPPTPELSSVGFLVRGVGAAAVVYLVETAHRLGVHTEVFFSAADSNLLVCREYLEPVADEMHIATDNGSEGYHGDARDIIDPVVQNGKIDHLYTCGSRRFGRYVQHAHAKGLVKGFLFLEGYMACGIGDCHGCAVKKTGGEGYYLVCQDGPVFPADTVEIE